MKAKAKGKSKSRRRRMEPKRHLHAVCTTCGEAQWLYCTGNPELGCENIQLEHIHTCPDCGPQGKDKTNRRQAA